MDTIDEEVLDERIQQIKNRNTVELHQAFTRNWQNVKKLGIEGAITPFHIVSRSLTDIIFKAIWLCGATRNASDEHTAWRDALKILAREELMHEARQVQKKTVDNDIWGLPKGFFNCPECVKGKLTKTADNNAICNRCGKKYLPHEVEELGL